MNRFDIASNGINSVESFVEFWGVFEVFLVVIVFCFLVNRWVDEVIPDAPLVLATEFLDKHKID